MFKVLSFLTLSLTVIAATPAMPEPLKLADKVVVYKTERRMVLLRAGRGRSFRTERVK